MDIDKVLSLEPRHFGALSGRAQIYIELKQYDKAIDDLKEIKKINPYTKVDKLIEEIEKLINGTKI